MEQEQDVFAQHAQAEELGALDKLRDGGADLVLDTDEDFDDSASFRQATMRCSWMGERYRDESIVGRGGWVILYLGEGVRGLCIVRY